MKHPLARLADVSIPAPLGPKRAPLPAEKLKQPQAQARRMLLWARSQGETALVNRAPSSSVSASLCFVWCCVLVGTDAEGSEYEEGGSAGGGAPHFSFNH